MAKKSDLKTRVNDLSVEDFLNSVDDNKKREDCFDILRIMEEVTGEKSKMWGSSIIGFGSYRYKGAGGREGDWMLTGFSPRKQNLVLYLMGGLDLQEDLLKKLGKHKTGVGCVYIKKVDDVNIEILKELVNESVKRMKNLYK
jgi:hypothetical protein